MNLQFWRITVTDQLLFHHSYEECFPRAFFVPRPDHFVRFNLADAISSEACDRARLWPRHLLKPSSHRPRQKVSYAQLRGDYE